MSMIIDYLEFVIIFDRYPKYQRAKATADFGEWSKAREDDWKLNKIFQNNSK